MSEEQPPPSASTLLLLAAEESSSSSGHSLLMVLGKGLFAALPIAGIAIGAVYFGQCPRQPLLPIYLVVLGVVMVLLLLLSCVPCGDGTDQPSAWTRRCRATCLLFLCAWFIAGNVWVYPIYPPNYKAHGHPSFCQQTLFLFAFGITTAVYVALAVALLFALCILTGVFMVDAILPYGGHGYRGGP